MALGLGACAGASEREVRGDYLGSAYGAAAPQGLGVDPAATPGRELAEAELGRGLAAYVALALERSPELQAAFARWRAAVHRISRARRLPEPTLSFGYFIRAVETRVGPQRARISLQQTFPWPTKLTAGADAASAAARAAQRRFDALALVLTQRVSEAYWSLWQLRRSRELHAEHLGLLRGLSELAQGRLATGAVGLWELQQLDLEAARLEDRIRGLDEAERAAMATLRAALGVGFAGPEEPGAALPTRPPPALPSLPTEGWEALAAAARGHPEIASVDHLADAADATARAEAAERLPSFTVAADWIVTGPATHAEVAGSGRDAVMVGAGLRVPLWQRSYGDAVTAARADAQALRHDAQALADRALAALGAALAAVRDGARRIALHQGTLLPQAEAAYASVLGAYTSGEAAITQLLLAERDLLDLHLELEGARADHARAWARLEAIVGREVLPGLGSAAGEGGVDTPAEGGGQRPLNPLNTNSNIDGMGAVNPDPQGDLGEKSPRKSLVEGSVAPMIPMIPKIPKIPKIPDPKSAQITGTETTTKTPGEPPR